MPKSRFDRSSMDRVAQATKGGALYELRNTDPEELQGFKRRTGSEIPSGGTSATALGIACRGDNTYLRLNKDIDSRTFTISFALKAGDVVKVGEYLPLVTVRLKTETDIDDANVDQTLPDTGYVLALKRYDANALRLVIMERINGVHSGGDAKNAELTNAIAPNDNLAIVFRKDGTTLYVTCSINGASDVTRTLSSVSAGNLIGNVVEILGAENMSVKSAAIDPVIQQLAYWTTHQTYTTAQAVPTDRTDYESTPAAAWKLNGQDAGSGEMYTAAIGTGNLHLHPSLPAIHSSALQFGSGSGAFEVPFTSEFISLFETKLRSVINDNWSVVIDTTTGEQFKNTTLFQFGELVKVYIDGTSLKADVNATTVTHFQAGTTDPTVLAANTAYKIAVSRHPTETNNITLTLNALATTGTANQNTAIDFMRLYNVLLGADEAQSQYYDGSVTKFAFYPTVLTKDAGKFGAMFYFDFSGDYLDLANSLPSRRTLHYRSADRPVLTEGSTRYTDGKYVSIGGGVLLTEGGPDGFEANIDAPITTDAQTQQVGDKLFIASNNKLHVADTKQSTIRTVGVPEPGTDCYVYPSGAGTLDGIYSYGYRFVTKDGTAGPIRRLNPVRAFDSRSVQIGVNIGSGGATGDSGERELGVSVGLTESENASPGYDADGASPGNAGSYYLIKDPKTSDATNVLTAGEFTVSTRAAIQSDNSSLIESVFDRGAKGSTDKHRWCSRAGLLPPKAHGNNEFSMQICFRMGAHDAYHTNKEAGRVLAMFGTEYWYSGFSGIAPDFMVSIVKANTSHEDEGSDQLGVISGTAHYRLVCFRKDENYGHMALYGKGFTGTHNDGVRASGQHHSCATPTGGAGAEGGPDDNAWEANNDIGGGIPFTDVTHPQYDASTTDMFNHTGSGGAETGEKSFWIPNHDYNLLITKEGSDLVITCMDVTGLDPREDMSSYLGGPNNRVFSARHPEWWRGVAAWHPNSNGGRSTKFIIGGGHFLNDNETTYYPPSRYTPVVPEDGRNDNMGRSQWEHGWLPNSYYLYQHRTWTKPVDPLAGMMFGWRRDAGLSEITILGQTQPGPLSYDILHDVAYIDDGLADNGDRFYDRAQSTAAGVLWKTHSANRGTNPSSTSNDAILKRGIEIGAGTNADPRGVREMLFPIVTIGDATDTFKNQSIRLYASSLYNGCLVLDNAGSHAFILGNLFWYEQHSIFHHSLNNYAVLQSADSTSFDLSSPTWYDFKLKVYHDTDVTPNIWRFGAGGWRINGQPDERSSGIFQLDLPSNGDDLNNVNADQLGAGFMTLGGHASLLKNKASIRLDEFRFWNSDRWNKNNSAFTENGHWIPANLGGRVVSRFCEDGDPDESDVTNNLWVYAKFQPADTYELNPSVTDVKKLAHYGTWAYHNGTIHTAARLTNQLDAIGRDVYTAAQPGMVQDYYVDDGDNLSDPPEALSIPKGPKHDIAAVELFRSRGIALDETQQEDDKIRARMTDVARSAPLYLLARLPLHDRFYIDSTYDTDLGVEVDDLVGAGPPDIVKGVFTWQGQVAVVSDNRDLFFSESGPYGWESFPSWLRYRVPIEIAGGEITAGVELGNNALVAGKGWAALLVGSPSTPDTISIGGGVGAENSKCLITHGGQAFAYNGKLWAIGGNGQAQEISRPLIGDLPSAANARLAISSKLGSLFLIDTSSGQALRYHLATARWTIEDRGAINMGDITSTGAEAWIGASGCHALADSSLHGDFVKTSQTPDEVYTATVATASAGTITLVTGKGSHFVVGTVVTLVHASALTGAVDSDRFFTGAITAVNSDVITLSGSDVDVHFNDGDSAYISVCGPVLVDTGSMYTQEESTYAKTDLDIIAGTNWYVGTASTRVGGQESSSGSMDFVKVENNQKSPVAAETRGNHHRLILRNFHNQSAHVAKLEVDIDG